MPSLRSSAHVLPSPAALLVVLAGALQHLGRLREKVTQSGKAGEVRAVGTVQLALPCLTEQSSAEQCRAEQSSAVQSRAVQSSAEQCRAEQCRAVQSRAVQSSAVQCSAGRGAVRTAGREAGQAGREAGREADRQEQTRVGKTIR